MHNIAESEREKGNPERLSAYLCGGVNPEPVNAYKSFYIPENYYWVKRPMQPNNSMVYMVYVLW